MRMRENWDAYFTDIDGQMASIFVNLGLGDAAPMVDRPWAVFIRLHLQAPNDNGFPGNEEFHVLEGVEDAILGFFEGLGAVYTGRITCGGDRLMLLYAKESCDPEPLLQEALGKFPEYRFEAWCEEQPDWHFYTCTLLPKPDEMQMIKNRHVLEVLEEHADTLEVPREVTHWAYFAAKEDRDAFVEAVEPFGYSVNKRDDSPGEKPFSAVLKRQDKVDSDSIDEVTLQLLRLANHHNGEYDGWETMLMAPDAPAAKQPWWKRLFKR